jgi:hypothetical protein
MTRRERATVQAELARAIAEQAALDRAFDSALDALSRSRPAFCGLSLSSTGVPTPRRSTETKHIDQSQDAEDAAFGPEDAHPAAAE